MISVPNEAFFIHPTLNLKQNIFYSSLYLPLEYVFFIHKYIFFLYLIYENYSKNNQELNILLLGMIIYTPSKNAPNQ